MQTIGRYEVVRPLGRGGMGQVFLARDPKLERSVALKLLNADRPETRGLFESEAKALAALSHPNIVTIFEIAEHEGRQFIAMEYLPGKSLRELLLGKPSRDELLVICAQVALALAAAHTAGILHRDIKPENVVVGEDAVKVVDFGIARRLGRSSMTKITSQGPAARAVDIVDAFTHTIQMHDDTLDTTAPLTAATHTICGTPGYMAPEVLMGEDSTPASDVYSLGVVLYECLTGKRPYDAPELHVVIARVIDGDEHPARLADPIGELVERMLDRDPARRPRLAEVVRRLARRPSTVARPRRRRAWIWIAAGALLISFAAISFVLTREQPAIEREPVAIQNIEITGPSFAANSPDPSTLGRVMTTLVESAGIRVIGPEAMNVSAKQHDRVWVEAAIRRGAMQLVRGKIVERSGRFVGELELVDLQDVARLIVELGGLPITIQPQKVEASADLQSSAALLQELAGKVAGSIRRGATLDRLPARAVKYFEDGTRAMRTNDWGSARVYLEQAVALDPRWGQAWDQLSTALSRGAFESEALHALANSIETTPDGPRRQVLRASLHVHKYRYAAAIAELGSLERQTIAQSDRLDVMYWLGEAHWHEGRHDLGFSYFTRILDLDPTYVPAMQHAGEYAVARRQGDVAARYLNMQSHRIGHVAFALRQYDALPEGGTDGQFRRWAEIVRDVPASRVPTSTTDPLALASEKIAIAAGLGDRAAVKREVAAFAKQIGDAPVIGVVIAELAMNIETLICAELADETRELLGLLHARAPDAPGYKRLALLATPLLGSPRFPDGVLTERLRLISTAIDALQAKDDARAAQLFDRLIRDPTWDWEYPERVILVRLLRRLGRQKELAALCDDTLHPAMMRHAYRIARRVCREQ